MLEAGPVAPADARRTRDDRAPGGAGEAQPGRRGNAHPLERRASAGGAEDERQASGPGEDPLQRRAREGHRAGDRPAEGGRLAGGAPTGDGGPHAVAAGPQRAPGDDAGRGVEPEAGRQPGGGEAELGARRSGGMEGDPDRGAPARAQGAGIDHARSLGAQRARQSGRVRRPQPARHVVARLGSVEPAVGPGEIVLAAGDVVQVPARPGRGDAVERRVEEADRRSRAPRPGVGQRHQGRPHGCRGARPTGALPAGRRACRGAPAVVVDLVSRPRVGVGGDVGHLPAVAAAGAAGGSGGARSDHPERGGGAGLVGGHRPQRRGPAASRPGRQAEQPGQVPAAVPHGLGGRRPEGGEARPPDAGDERLAAGIVDRQRGVGQRAAAVAVLRA